MTYELTQDERRGVVALMAERLAELAPIRTTDDGVLIGRWYVKDLSTVDQERGHVRVVLLFGSRARDLVEVWVRHQTDEPSR